MTPLEAMNELAALSIRGSFWRPYRFLEENVFLFNDWMHQIRPLSAGLLVLFFVLEILRHQKAFLEGENPAAAHALFAGSALLGAFLTVPGLYFEGVKLAVGVGSYLAQVVHTANVDALDMEIQNLMKGILGSTQNPVALFTAFLELFTPVGLLTVVAYYLVIAALFMLPYVQALFIAVFVLLGPFLLPFALWNPTRAVARKWFLTLMGSAFLSVFGIIAYTAISVSGILTNLAMAGERHVPSLVYSFTTLAFLLSVVWSSYRLFGAMSLSIRQGLARVAGPLRKVGALRHG
jgi:hypothetical protein